MTRALRFAIVAIAAAVALLGEDRPQRIVSLAPSTTEILYGVGAFGQVVAVSQFDSYPPEVKKLPRVGGWQTSNAEKIVAQHPDLVVMTTAQVPFMRDKLDAFSLRSVAVPADTLADIFAAIKQIGDATGHTSEASDLARRTHLALDEIRKQTDHAAVPTVLLVISRTPGSLSDMYVATQGSYLVDVLSIAGGRSVAAPAPAGYAKLSKEALLALNPDIIIDVLHSTGSNWSESVQQVWGDLPELKAVRTKRVYELEDPFVPHPSQLVVHTAELFEHILHPELKR